MSQRWEVWVGTTKGEKYYRYLEKRAAEKSYRNKVDWYKKVPSLTAEIQLNDLKEGTTLKSYTVQDDVTVN